MPEAAKKPINLDEDNDPIDSKDEKYAKMLSNLQGNILKSHGRPRAVFLFLGFPEGDQQAVKKWIAQFSEKYVTRADQQLQEAQEFADDGVPGRTFAGIYISASGYHKLGFALKKFVEADVGGTPETGKILFTKGMASETGTLNDPARKAWEDEYRDHDMDALVVLADGKEKSQVKALADIQTEVEASLNGVATILKHEKGETLYDADNNPIEHFGFRDGISQPLYYRADMVAAAAGSGPWLPRANPAAPLNLVLLKDPFAPAGQDCFGSYLVFRKLEQNVKKFRKTGEELAATLGLPSGSANVGKDALAEALIVGRFKNGVPVMLSKTANANSLEGANNFDYESYAYQPNSSSKCPFQAHIRKANPRCSTGDTLERRRRITRRGITYGDREIGADGALLDAPEQGVGLLFMCFQSSIPNQFAFIQIHWANNLHLEGGFDPITGRMDGTDAAVPRKWPQEWGVDSRVTCALDRFVTLKGGEFFFAPSLPFLLSLA